ncbi:MAG: molybdopterin molybdenumtransferase MoeA, partial [Desulfuromonadales bacterium]|nr:molybdopterin molybdenumtransferase MoeA [Desulfuromonadales bacterium]NIS43602.1 molybdopterin molybdenumtransferase MoeA [Desulfuromonadales bacterium]
LCDQLDMQVHFWKLAIKPGKPVLFATRNGIPFFGLPGNPAASAATFEILVRPALRRLAGHPHPTPVKVTASLTGPVKNSGKREHFLWGSAISGKQGLEFTPSLRQESGQNRTMQGFNA